MEKHINETPKGTLLHGKMSSKSAHRRPSAWIWGIWQKNKKKPYYGKLDIVHG